MKTFAILLAAALPLLATTTPAPAAPPAVAAVPVMAAAPAAANEAWVATHALYRGQTVHQGDIVARAFPALPFGSIPIGHNVVGMEVKNTVYAGRVLTDNDVGAPSLVKVNALVEVVWKARGIVLELQGRALDSGAEGDDVRVLNTETSRTIHGIVVGDGLVEVQNVQ